MRVGSRAALKGGHSVESDARSLRTLKQFGAEILGSKGSYNQSLLTNLAAFGDATAPGEGVASGGAVVSEWVFGWERH
jgi:hypothetical protein